MIKLTESAVNRVREMVANREAVIGLRIGVTESGCSGYSYALDFAESVSDNDTVIEQDDIKVVIDDASMPILDGVELDFVKQGLNQSFKFNNPNVVSSCGCGESFSTTK
ncbi:MAG: iron-sulfur cluster assembly accessory protein [Gammaproteobacteria bacterium]|nr:iron-sulfur cluster assembly accessory protein [Gammaproteobacteria bacterium]MDH5591308.1 iron-sulfur cluster assembly accessory protein [Gammaproteobacteria bacterium]